MIRAAMEIERRISRRSPGDQDPDPWSEGRLGSRSSTWTPPWRSSSSQCCL